MSENLQEKKARLRSLLEKRAAATSVPEIAPRAARSELEPLSYAQEALWFVSQLEGPNAAYNNSFIAHFSGTLDVAALNRAMTAVVARHETLRTRFVVRGGVPSQVFDPVADVYLQPELVDPVEGSAVYRAEARRPFDVDKDPLYRARLFRESASQLVLVVSLHHIISDAWSVGLFLRDLLACYVAYTDGRDPALVPLAVTYADYVSWHREWLEGGALERQLHYWREQLKDLPAAVTIPADHPSYAAQTIRGGTVEFAAPLPLVERLAALSNEHRCSLFVTLLAALAVVLHRHSAQTDVAIGTGVSSRRTPELEGLIGYFVNTLVVRIGVEPEQTFASVLKAAREVFLQAMANQDAPYHRVVEELRPHRTDGASPHFQVMVTMQSVPSERRIELPSLTVDAEIPTSESAKFDLSVALQLEADGLHGQIEYRAGLFDAATVQRLGTRYVRLLEEIVADPQLEIGRYALLAEDERRLLLDEWSGHARVQSSGQSIQTIFEERVRENPAATALVYRDRSMSYGELNAMANRLARHLRSLGVQGEAVVGICAERGFPLIAGILAILKAGGAYLPLDPDVPADRMRYQLADAGVKLLLTTAAVRDLIPGDIARLIVLDELLNADALAALSGDDPEPRGAGDTALAYVMYTSGSTGQPKGVAIEHRGITRLVRGARWIDLDSRTVTIQHSSIAFDASTLEIWAPLLNGGTLVLRRGESADVAGLVEQVARHGVNTVWLSAGVLPLWVDCPGSADVRLRYLLAGGDVVSERHVREVYAGDPHVVVMNGYGPTENTTFSCCYPVPRDRAPAATLPIGRPITGTDAYVLDGRMQLQPIGCVGELYVGGAGLGRGYLNKPELTARSFVPHPFSADPQDRLYRTGDRVRWLPSGDVEFLGRADNQVKIRGFRVELDEIEFRLMQLPDVRLGAVVVREDATLGKRLVAYAAPADDAALADRGQFISGCKAALRKTLPDYMVPSTFVVCDELPLTPNGKVDRRRLPDPAEEDLHRRVYRGPRDETERTLCAIWEEVLRVGQVGLDDSFFDLGGHSLLATQLVARIRERLAKTLPLDELFRNPTVAGVAAVLADAPADEALEELPSITADEANRSEPFPMTGVQQAYWLGRSGVFELGNISTHSYVEVELSGFDLARFESAWNALIARHGMLRAIFTADGTQRILPAVPRYGIVCDDVRELSDGDRQSHLDRVRDHASHQIFDATQWPLFELRATRLSDRRYRMHFSMDSLPSDAMSSMILVRELDQLYADPSAVLPPLTVSFREYVLGLDAIHASPFYARSRAYWEARVATLPSAPDLPLAKDPAAVTTPRFGRRFCTLDRAQWDRLQERARAAGVTPSALLVSAFSRVLGRWSRSRHFTLTLTLFNRLPVHPDVDALVGDFTSLIPLEIDDRAHKPLADFGRDVQSRLWSDMDHRYFDGIEVLRLLNRRSGSGKPVFMPVVFTSTLGLPVSEEEMGMLARALSDMSQEGSFGITQTSQVWLDNVVGESQGRLTITWDALEELFPAGVLDAMFAAYRALLEGLAAGRIGLDDVEQPLFPQEQAEVRRFVNATETEVPPFLLQDLFREQVGLRAHAPAVIQGDVTLDYAELDRRARAIAHALRARGVRPNELVAIVMVKGWEQAVAALGILYAGAAYLPIDAALPAERIALLLAQGEARIAITQRDVAVALPQAIDILAIDRGAVDDVTVPPSPARADDLAYVIFTSGSTGMPKGVMIDHRGAVNTIVDINRRFGVNAADRVLGLSSLSFDLSVYDIFGVLGAGGALVLPDRSRERDTAHWVEVVQRHGVTIWNTVPVLAQLFTDDLLKAPGAGASMRLVMMSGDWIPLPLPARLNATCPGALLVSLGGATEASIWSNYHVIERVEEGWTSIPYGRPLANQRFHVLAPDLSPAPDWVAGDLLIAGIGLAKGYWRDEEKTRRSFFEHPVTGERLYRTGDLGRYWPDGTIEFLGREDTQVKVHGHRIELGEIEAALSQHEGIAAAAVAAVGEAADRRLVAYFVPADPAALADTTPQAAFERGQPGLRKLPPSAAVVPLASSGDGVRLAPAAAFRDSGNGGEGSAIGAEHLGRWLSALAQVPVEGHPIPKRYYPSAGSLYPVQVYLSVREDAVDGLASGSYYYDPTAHALVRLGAAVAGLPPGARLGVFLAAVLPAIEPVYGPVSDRLCLLEAGHIAGLLASAAPVHGLSFAASECGDDSALRGALRLDDGHRLLVRGVAAPAAGQPPALAVRALERQSYREFLGGAPDLDRLTALLSALPDDDGPAVHLFVKGSGLHRFDRTAKRLVHVADAGEELMLAVHFRANRGIHARGAFSIFLTGAGSDRELLVAGAAGQALMVQAPRFGFGLCPIGRFTAEPLRETLRLGASETLLYCFEGGAIREEQTARWPAESPDAAGQELEDLRDFLRAKLPAYMVPSMFVPIERLPLNQNGKVDRKALPKVGAPAPRAAQYQAPRNELEETIARKWAELLRIERVGVLDDFLEIGGDSLSATRFVSAMRSSFSADAARLSLEMFFATPTVAAVAELIAVARDARRLEENSALLDGELIEEGAL